MEKNILFEYADNVLPDKERERFLIGQAKRWFEPLKQEIADQEGTINFFLKERGENRLYLNNMAEDLKDRLHERFKLFEIPRPQ